METEIYSLADWSDVMILCGEGCVPCCDFCVHCEHDQMEFDGRMVDCEPIGCTLHRDEEHQLKAESCGFCDDFHCFRVKEDKSN